ncbi:MAG: DNA-3-methyladenine glycosylase [Bacteroidota bacterium]
MPLSTKKRLPKSFYTRQDVVQISKDLLGKVIVTNFANQRTAGKIVETEAYRAPDDKACHAYNNRLTERTKIMFAEGGTAYVYLCYGIHHLFNVVTATEGVAHAVLIRAVEPLENVALMLERRNKTKINRQLTGGPGVMSKALGITTAFTGISLLEPNSPVWLEDRGFLIEEKDIIASPRVGVDYAEECALWDWRFRIKDSKWTSPAK